MATVERIKVMIDGLMACLSLGALRIIANIRALGNLWLEILLV